MFDTKQKPEEFKFYYLFFLALTFLFSMLMPFSYGDLAVWIAEGRQIFLQKTIYINDVFSFNPTSTFPYPWLSCVLYYFIDLNFGIKAIFFIHRLIPVFIVGFWLKSYPHLLQKKNWFLLVLCISGLSMMIVDRPALLTLPFILLSFYAIENEQIHKKKFQCFFMVTLWVNLHGSFVLFFLLLIYKYFIELLQKRTILEFKEKLTFFILCLGATSINPWGYKIYNYVFQTMIVSKVRMSEWQPLTFAGDSDVLFETSFFALTALFVVLTNFKRCHLNKLFSSPIMFIFLSSLNSVRNLPLFYMTLPLFCGNLNAPDLKTSSARLQKTSALQILFNRFIITIILAAGLFLFTDYSQEWRAYLPKRYQKTYDYTACFQIANYLNSQISDKKIFNSWVLGSFLMYSQKNKIFIDTRNIIYTDTFYNDYWRIMTNFQNSAEVLLDKYQADFAISDTAKGLTKALMVSQNWTFILEDNGYALFQRK